MLGQFSYRGGKDLDTGQKTVSPLRAFPFSFFFSPLFFFFFFCRAASRAQRTLSFRFRFPGKFSAPILPPLRSAPNRVIKIRPPSFIHLLVAAPLLRASSNYGTFPFSPSSLLVSLVRSYFAKKEGQGPVVFAEGNEESLERSQTGKRSILANLLCLTSDA